MDDEDTDKEVMRAATTYLVGPCKLLISKSADSAKIGQLLMLKHKHSARSGVNPDDRDRIRICH